jgi:lactate dehydrogenase-like 2-hydroxyacid dehydrogenase
LNLCSGRPINERGLGLFRIDEPPNFSDAEPFISEESFVTKPCIVQVSKLSAAGDARLRDHFEVLVPPAVGTPDEAAFWAGPAATAQALVTTAPVGASEALMRRMPGLKAIACRGIGTDKIDLEAAARLGIQVSTTPDVLTDCVADLAMGLLLDAARGLSASDRFVRAGQWPKGAFPLATRVSGKRLGVLGLGQIGAAIARRAEGFSMEIRYHNRRPLEQSAYAYMDTPVALAEWADFLMVAVSGGAQTQGLVSDAVLEALGPKGFLINIARGSVIDEPALIRRLQAGTLAGAGLDVFVNEPHVPDAFMDMDHVVLLPHVGSGTAETRRAMEDLVMDNLRQFFSAGTLKTPVLTS